MNNIKVILFALGYLYFLFFGCVVLYHQAQHGENYSVEDTE